MTTRYRITLVLTLLLITLSGCQSMHSSHTRSTIAAGDISEQELLSAYPYFKSSSATGEAPPAAISQLKSITTPTDLTVYFGVWCHDSIREIPRLLQLHKQLDNPNISLQLIALDTNKQEPLGRAKANQILYTPTIVVSQNGVELGRIIEKPEQNLATDLVKIVYSEKKN